MPPRKGSPEAAGITPERLAFIEELLDEGWSFRQIQLTHRVSWKTLNRHFKGRGMCQKEAAKLGAEARRAFHNMNHR